MTGLEMPLRVAALGFLLSLTMMAAPGLRAQETLRIVIGYVHIVEPRLTLSVLDEAPPDDGIAGAQVGIADNNTTGRFLKQEFILRDIALRADDDALAAVDTLIGEGANYLVLDMPGELVLAIADAVKDHGVLVFNAGALDDSLREEACRANVFHTAPTRSMLADGLAQYLAWKQWRNWFLISGSNPQDILWADALKRAATRFGAKIVEERRYEDTGGSRRTDTGHVQVQRQIPVFTQGAPDHDVVIAADESEVFATYLPFRTWDPRPVAGSAGLRPDSWHPAHEQWGAAQIQNRFEKANGRRMRSKDMQAWTAVRIVGEAATRTSSGDPAVIRDFITAEDFSIAAFKGQRVTFRRWNWQLRQPILLSDGRDVVSVSPQEGFLHQLSELDTLGIDEPETACELN